MIFLYLFIFERGKWGGSPVFPIFFKTRTMYRADAIKEGFIHLLGWRQGYDMGRISVREELTQSETGQYFQDMHPLVTLSNVRSVAPAFRHEGFRLWDAETAYKAGQVVRVETEDSTGEGTDTDTDEGTAGRKRVPSVLYRALEDNTGVEPEDNPDIWEKADLFSDWLQAKTEAGILKAVEGFYSSQLADKTVRNLLEGKVLFDGAGRLADTVRGTGSIVGFEIVPARAEGVTLRIERIGLQFNKAGTVKLYLMHTSSPEPVKEIEVEYTRNGGMQWTDVQELYLPYVSDGTDAGGSWFLCYSQKELPDGMLAVQKNRDWSKAPCPSCNRIDYANWAAWSKYMEVHPFKVPAGDAMEMWDVEDNVYTYTTNYGLNLKVTMECDVTDILLSQRRAFQNVVGLQVAADMLREFAYNPDFRINRTQQNFSRNELLYELDGDSTGTKPGGILYRLDKAMAALKVDLTGMSRICMPCNNGGIRYRTT